MLITTCIIKIGYPAPESKAMAIPENRQQLQTDLNRVGWVKYLPFLRWLRQYQRADFPGDFIAGLTVATMLIPQSMAYALLAGLPPIVGLYTGILPVLVYGLLGSTRILSLGPTAITSVMVLSSIGHLSEPGSAAYFTLSLTLALSLGIVYLLMGLLRLGFVVNLLSESVLQGYVNAAALIIVISQIQNLLGIHVPRSALPAEILLQIILSIGKIHLPTVLLACICMGIILLFNFRLEKWLARFRLNQMLKIAIVRSGSLVSVLVGILIVAGLRLDTQGISIIGKIPAGLPPIQFGPYDFSDLQAIFTGAFAIAFVGFMEGISTAKSLMSQRRQTIDANQELIAMGAANIAGAISGGFSSTISISRSAVNYAAGANTSLSSIIAAGMVALVVSLFTPFFYYLPNATLAAIILTSVFKLFDVHSLRQLWKYSKLDTIPFFVTFLITFFVSIPLGIAGGILFSLVSYFVRTSRPEIEELGRLDYTEYYRDKLQYKEAQSIPGVLIIRIDESLYFANAQYLDKYLRNIIATSPDIHWLILVGDAINWLDASALQILETLIHDLEQVGVTVFMTEFNLKVWGRVGKVGFIERVEANRFFHTTHEAVKATGTLLDDELPI